MTRTERAHHPRAISKDRSEPRSGLDTSVRKDGAGQHNWGSIAHEQKHVFEAMEDELREEGMDENKSVAAAAGPDAGPVKVDSASAHISDEELEEALKYRKHALKKHGGINLVDIARTSAAVGASSTGLVRRNSENNTNLNISNGL